VFGEIMVKDEDGNILVVDTLPEEIVSELQRTLKAALRLQKIAEEKLPRPLTKP
jgi:hypothetical protein